MVSLSRKLRVWSVSPVDRRTPATAPALPVIQEADVGSVVLLPLRPLPLLSETAKFSPPAGERIAAGARIQAAPPPPFGVTRRDAAAQRGGSRLGPHPKVSYPCVETGYQEGADAAIENLQAGFNMAIPFL
jgi:hypothetical protein